MEETDFPKPMLLPAIDQNNVVERIHPGLKFSYFCNVARSSYLSDKFEMLCKLEPNSDIASPEVVRMICSVLKETEPDDFKQLVQLIELVCMTFVISVEMDDVSARMDCLEWTFQLDVAHWDTHPVMLHMITKQLLERLQNDRNVIFVARSISKISRIGQNIAICLMWAIFFSKTGEEIKMYRFYKFSEITKILEHIDTDQIHKDPNIVSILLEAISFLLNAIVLSRHDDEMKQPFSKYLTYNKDDLGWLRTWCKVVIQKFPVNINDANSIYNKTIKDLVEQDIMEYLNDLIGDNSIEMDWLGNS